MRIGKTVLTFVLGSCLPATVLFAWGISVGLSSWSGVTRRAEESIFAAVPPGIEFLAAGLFLLTLGSFWLRNRLRQPLQQLASQLDGVDACETDFSPIEEQKVSSLAGSMNRLLAELFTQKEHARITLASISEAVIVTDQCARVRYLNPLAEKLLQIREGSVLGEPIASLFGTEAGLDVFLKQFMDSGQREARRHKLSLPSQRGRILARSISNLWDHRQTIVGNVIVLRDITQEERLKRQLNHRAYFDPVTGLANRLYFEERLDKLSQKDEIIALCYLDLEQFKLINDSCGHDAGDTMLAMVAKALQSGLGPTGLLGRLGGDEFGLAIVNGSEYEVTELLGELQRLVSMQVLHHADCHYKVGMSIGVAMGSARHVSARELLKDANIACIAAKTKGSNQIHFYDDQDKALTDQRNAPKWAVRIAQAIEQSELKLYFQPIEGVVGGNKRQRMEILLRIEEACGRILPPAQFIAAAERFKLMPEVDKEVIRKAFLWLSMRSHLWADHCLSINLSGNSLGAEGMVDYIVAQQQRFEIPSQCICFEITETSAIQNRNRAMTMLLELRQQGFSFALDDFGSGFASYGYLRELPVDYVKIDGCFVKSLATNAKDYAIVKSIHDVCRVMGIETVAEFVENQDILDCLKRIGINYAQGYAIGRPKALEDYPAGQLFECRVASLAMAF